MEISCGYPVIDMIRTGENITRLRKKCGYSIKALQEYCGLGSIQAVYKWQNGESLPMADNLLALSLAFGVSINEILVYSEVGHAA